MFLSIATQSQHRLNSVLSQCAHVNSLLRESRKYIQNFFTGKKKLFKNVTLQSLNFILMFNDKIFLIWSNVNFVSTGFHCIKQYKKNKENLTLHHMGKIFIS